MLVTATSQSNRLWVYRLHTASEEYHYSLSKKKDSEALGEGEKLLPIDALGIVMIKHGEEFGEDSAFGTSLVSLGRAHCQVATLQETFAMTFEDTYLASLRLTEDEIKEYQAQRKKLESRRLSYDAALSKLDKVKNSKKDKDRNEAEDECENARSRYEETAEDVRARMHAIQENEVAQLHDLTALVDLELNFVEQYLQVLREVKSTWVEEAVVRRMEATRPKGPMHVFARTVEDLRAESVKSTKSAMKNSALADSSDDAEETTPAPRSRGFSLSRRKSEASNSKPPSRAPSRPQSRASRKRSDSTATAMSDKEKEKAERVSRKLSVAGWASSAASAVSSVASRGKKDKDKDNFSALRDDHDESSDEERSDDWGDTRRPPSALSSSSHKSRHRGSKSGASTPSTSPQKPARISKSPYGVTPVKDTRKVVMALHDFAAASSDELSFRSGDRIAVVNEVLDGWWMGELAGRRGLFPTTYTEALSSTGSLPSAPQLPLRPPEMLKQGEGSSAPGTLTIDADEGRRKYFGKRDFGASSDEEHPFGDHNLADSQTPTYGRFGSRDTLSSTGEDDEERLMPQRLSDFDEDAVYVKRPSERSSPVLRPSDLPVHTTPTKKPPPPPPPRRFPGHITAAPTPPPIPSRPLTLNSKSSQSSSNSLLAMAAMPTLPSNADVLTHSPFDSPKDIW
ncbi:uncharacterized protein FIBRA_03745 [Fibroporia radiculosa]|uniref:SH3 domain-containing protein n=1 Tax=Fibroporia radiculosa TaxID=599839 RepID=J4I9S7_9APHY|nr:uncharacterized protein FIBRA_03745 [Fibroporia radiculosa]CCM01681.1 predicted protein [Fibroporia radiculosa]